MKSYVLAFVIGGVIFAAWLRSARWVEANYKKQSDAIQGQVTPTPASTPAPSQNQNSPGNHNNQQQQNNSGGINSQQSTSGNNSPIMGDHSHLTIYSGPIYSAPQVSKDGFHEDEALPKTVTFSVGEHGISSTVTVDSLKLPLDKQSYVMGIDGFIPFKVRVENNKLVCDVRIWNGQGVSPVEVIGNKFVVNVDGWERNFTDNAFEVVNAKGLPVFQLIRKTKSLFIFKGYIPLPGGDVLIANDSVHKVEPNYPIFSEPIPRIFKYPAYSHQGQYAESESNR